MCIGIDYYGLSFILEQVGDIENDEGALLIDSNKSAVLKALKI